MKTLKLLLLVVALAPMGSAMADEQPQPEENNALIACKAKAEFSYHFDMMKIEGDEMMNKETHDGAAMKKMSRQTELQAEYMMCESENKK